MQLTLRHDNNANKINNLSAIAAISLNGVLSYRGKIPWHNAIDNLFFNHMTAKSILIMGRKTFESLKTIHPDRIYYVLTRQHDYHSRYENVKIFCSIDDMKKKINNSNSHDVNIFVCGGHEIYKILAPSCKKIFLSVIKKFTKEIYIGQN